MGRGGGGGGGHRSGGGSFHYSGGGRSGRGSSLSSHRSSSSYSGGYRSYGGYGSYYRGGRAVVNVYTGLGWRMQMVTNIIITLFVCITLTVLILRGGGSELKSTVERTKLSASECTLTDNWFQDDVEWIFDEKELLRGMRSFYSSTGVQPFLWITDNINGKVRPTESDFEMALNQKYDELFTDEGHLIVCFMESSPNTWATYAWAGDAARSVMDAEAIDILHGYFSRYYTNDMEDEEYMSTVFEKTGSSIMTVAKSTKARTITVIGVVTGLGLVAVIVIVLFALAKKRKEQAEIDRDILNTDIGDVHDPLEDKYGDDGI